MIIKLSTAKIFIFPWRGWNLDVLLTHNQCNSQCLIICVGVYEICIITDIRLWYPSPDNREGTSETRAVYYDDVTVQQGIFLNLSRSLE